MSKPLLFSQSATSATVHSFGCLSFPLTFPFLSSMEGRCIETREEGVLSEGAQTTPSATENEAVAGSVAVCNDNPDNYVSPCVSWSETDSGADLMFPMDVG